MLYEPLSLSDKKKLEKQGISFLNISKYEPASNLLMKIHVSHSKHLPYSTALLNFPL